MKYGAVPTNLAERLALAAGRVPIPLLDSVYSIVKARALMAGVRLGVFEALRDGPLSADEVAARCGLHAEPLDLLLRTLAFAGYLRQQGGRYALSRLGRRSMLAGAPQDFTGFVRWNDVQWRLVEGLESLLRTGRGADFHATMDGAEAWADYQRAMLEVARLDARLLAARVPVRQGARSLLDLAGSHGLLGAAICRRHPPMRSTVIDLPHAVEPARGLAAAEGIADVVEHRSGDLRTADLGSERDVVLLANILHHFDATSGRDLVARAQAALGPEGTIAVWEIERPRSGAPPTDGDGAALFFSITSNGCTYHGDEYVAWLRDAGFERVRATRPALAPGKVLVVGRRG